MADLIRKAKAVLLFAWDVLIPRFITEDVALAYVGGPAGEWYSYEIACSLDDVEPGESFDGIATVDSFQAFGFGLTYKIWNFRPWPVVFSDRALKAVKDVINRCWDESNGRG